MISEGEALSSQERLELEEIAEDLRKACPNPTLSSAFSENLEEAFRSSWTFRAAMQRSPLIRVAASLLMVSLVAAPVAALVSLVRIPDSQRPVIGFSQALDLSEEELTPAAEKLTGTSIVGPEDEYDLVLGPWSEGRLQALEQSNRLALAGASWRRAFPEGWKQSFAGQGLWSSFLWACATGDTIVAKEFLQQQISQVVQPDAATQTAIAAWHWVLSGETTALSAAPLAWKDAPFLRHAL